MELILVIIDLNSVDQSSLYSGYLASFIADSIPNLSPMFSSCSCGNLYFAILCLVIIALKTADATYQTAAIMYFWDTPAICI